MFDSVTQAYIDQQLATELPYALVCTGGIVVALAFWRRAPSSSLYVLLANKCQSSLLTLPGRADKGLPCRASYALSTLGPCITS